ncbi:hypothetical protein U9M73_11540 [Paenibacillus phoenicis]|uniref:DUF7678 domain-containing protein n=1 Tax=Paenibacillus phoenicis TaxID=554117 RepID=A0ABU5PL09_9BACL|nr:MULTISPECIES: hypothetical protein [Paenibacillus]EES71195.1 hypothetical protein POTG_04198 [Paenibacillus sp. oral taxon 786 str. D14]MEA3570631.1 hypothetical protein [Paenibacillus phoenicis]
MFREKGSVWMGRRFVGEVDGYYVEAQVFDEPSTYGIAFGRISRLDVYPDRSSGFRSRIACYERGWDGGPPQDRRIRRVVEKTVEHFDRKQVDWAVEEKRYRESRE